ncbi:molybdopterin-guanine dinucleotide biosynthesis protein B [Halobacillus sp. Marseille-P3879]|uniref:molybdopterin-guanine dinucleotide biosynthesis protein B n=1 Tax=Halobacillus sp. Marseille-P3879 TaxID=2045014 RepID=UPI000C7E3B14|nr:molybdopterin-guanine dinucleotide biosynthesis protein B [Halobacillus sp. Marseille-P3879]
MAPRIFQVVGYKNSGKTTLLKKLVQYSSSILEERVIYLKHHGHIEPLSQKANDADSVKLYQNGAFAACVTGASQTQMHLNIELSLSQLIDWHLFLEPDLILIEGFKTEKYPKAVILKDEADLNLLNLSNIKLIFVWDANIPLETELPVYHIKSWQNSIGDIYSCIKGGKEV